MNATDFVEMCLKKGSTPTSVSRSDDLRLPSKEDVTAAFVNVCRTKYKKNIVSWTPPDPTYPDYMLLAGDRGILAYIRFLYFSSQTAFDTKKLALPTFPLLQTVTKAESQLDRPVFFVWVINFPDKSEIRFKLVKIHRPRNVSRNNGCVVFACLPVLPYLTVVACPVIAENIHRVVDFFGKRQMQIRNNV